jgi:hypothetical protein
MGRGGAGALPPVGDSCGGGGRAGERKYHVRASLAHLLLLLNTSGLMGRKNALTGLGSMATPVNLLFPRENS